MTALHVLKINWQTNYLHNQIETSKQKHGTHSKIFKELQTNIAMQSSILFFQWTEAQRNPFRTHREIVAKTLLLFEELGIDWTTAPQNVPVCLKAELLFRIIDSNNSGFIDLTELEVFLMSFGVADVAKKSMKLLVDSDDNQNESIDLKEFEKHFEPFYNYAYESIASLIKTDMNPYSTRNKLEKLINSTKDDNNNDDNDGSLLLHRSIDNKFKVKTFVNPTVIQIKKKKEEGKVLIAS
jgi:hypothetical protein